MRSDCHAFRSCLSSSLAGAPHSAGLPALGWHAHLLGCPACRHLLAQEEALEQILSSLPDPKLPPGLAKRVLARLERARGELDLLLDLDVAEEPPPTLASSVLSGVRRAQERALDRLLESAREVELPSDLCATVLAACRAELEPRPRLRARARSSAAGSGAGGSGAGVWQQTWPRLAAGILIALGGFALWRIRPAGAPVRNQSAQVGEVLADGTSPAGTSSARAGAGRLDSAESEGVPARERELERDEVAEREPRVADAGQPPPEARGTDSSDSSTAAPEDELLAMLDVLLYVQLPSEEPDAELDAYIQLDEASMAMLEFSSASSAVFDGWDGWNLDPEPEVR